MKYRYEIKIPISRYNENIFSNFLLSLKRIRIHNDDREINNIYFDTFNFDSAKNNLDGIPYRTKYRARWYKKDNKYSNCNIELKIKNGRLNSKLVIPTNFDSSKIIKKNFFDLVKDDFVKMNINDRNLLVHKFFPTVQNKYKRSYYIYEDEIRLTYDKKVEYKNLKTQSISDWHQDTLSVLEIKFDDKKLSKAEELITRIPFVPKRHSKYLRGLSYCKMAMYI